MPIELQKLEINCKYCGVPIDISKAQGGVIQCEYCTGLFAVAKSVEPEVLELIRIGNHELSVCEFDKAHTAFKRAAQKDKSECEAYFGMALAAHKVQYLYDEVNKRPQPICHEIKSNLFVQDKNFMKALELATKEQKEQYIKQAKEIDYIRQEFYKISNSGLDYDCFICVKVTDDETGGKTKDYKTAEDLYYHLRHKGYNPFFSELEMGNRTGADYEALILYALYTSECMIVVCSDENYLQTDWVKNEYTRFLKMVTDEEKECDSITVAFNGKPIDLPNRKGKIQGIDMAKLNGTEIVVEFVENHTPEARKRREEAKKRKLAEEEERKRKIEELEAQLKELQTVKPDTAVAPLLKRAKQFAEAEDYDNAINYYNRALDTNPECGEAWLGLFLANHKVDSLNKLVDIYMQNLGKLKKDMNYVNAKRYASPEVLQKITEFEKTIIAQNFEIEGTTLKKYIGKDSVVIIPDSVTSIGVEAFKDCSSITSITIPSSVTSIDYLAFSGCCSLTNITLPDGVTRLGMGAFLGCCSLTNITLPDSVTCIDYGAFGGCDSLQYNKYDNGLYLGNDDNPYLAFIAVDNIKLLSCKIHLNTRVIGGMAFGTIVKVDEDFVAKAGCGLTSITIPNGLTSICVFAFAGCDSLTSIVIPNSVTNIDCYAFSGCDSLTIYCEAESQPLGWKPDWNKERPVVWGYVK